jgi:hypothetical protein
MLKRRPSDIPVVQGLDTTTVGQAISVVVKAPVAFIVVFQVQFALSVIMKPI